MTMPHLMNCPHRDEGWCLECVGKQWEEMQALRQDSVRLAYLYGGQQTGSDALVQVALKMLNGQTLTLDAVRAAIDDAMATPLVPPELVTPNV